MMIDGQRSSDLAYSTVLAYYKAFNAGDWEGMLSWLADDVVHDINQGGTEVGKDAFRAFLARMNRSYLATDEGLPEARGQQYVLPGGAFFELRGGKIARVTNYYNLQDWLRQVGA